MPSPDRTRNRRGALATAGIYLGLIIAAAITVLPFVFSIITAFKSPQNFANQSPLSLPDPWTFESFQAILSGRVELGRAILITLGTVVVTVLCQVTSSVLAAYAFARLQFPGRDAIFWLFLSTMMIPGTVLIVPLYLMVAEAGLKDTFAGLVVPFLLASPYAVFLLREYFRGIPQDVIDAARIDGAGHLRILARIVVPLSTPILATLLLITVVSQWNSFMWPRVIAGNEVPVITVATASVQSQYVSNWTYVMAATTIALVPLIVVFVIFQKQIVRSIAITGIK
ncbi:carbohydrate ABC transporter permease [Microbacterium gilvum]|uniref:Carbohydrate ABC transporter permease n=1 Tax=Microbacterium gilvum TaxID=1336204 RepID=A0ABP8ZV10_9MICO